MSLGLKLVRGDETRKVMQLPETMSDLRELSQDLFGLVGLSY
jgi:hypothetical protein